MGVSSNHTDGEALLRVAPVAHDESDGTFYFDSSGSSTPTLPRNGRRGSLRKPPGGLKASPIILFSTIVCVSVLSVLSVLAYASYTPAVLHELHKTVTTKKLLWWDSWYHGRVTKEEIERLPQKCLDYRLSVYHKVANIIVPDDTEQSYNPLLQAAKELAADEAAGRTSSTEQRDAAAASAALAFPHVDIPKSIYFLHYNPLFTMYRYICSIESAARMNPQHTITVFAKNVTDFETKLAPWRTAVGRSMADRVRVRRIDYTGYFQATPLEEWWRNGSWRQSHWVGQNLGNALRLAVVYKEGGVYLDMDIISLNPLEEIGRAIAREEKIRINNAAMSFPKLDPLVWALMEEFVEGWNGWEWANNGPYSVTRMFQKRCQKTCLQLGLLPEPKFKRPTPTPATSQPTPQQKTTPPEQVTEDSAPAQEEVSAVQENTPAVVPPQHAPAVETVPPASPARVPIPHASRKPEPTMLQLIPPLAEAETFSPAAADATPTPGTSNEDTSHSENAASNEQSASAAQTQDDTEDSQSQLAKAPPLPPNIPHQDVGDAALPANGDEKEEENVHPSGTDEPHEFGDHASGSPAAPAQIAEEAFEHAGVVAPPPDTAAHSSDSDSNDGEPATASERALPPARRHRRRNHHYRLQSRDMAAFGLFYEDYADPARLADAPFCENVHVFQPARFYPVHYSTRAVLMDPWEVQCDVLAEFKRRSVGLHWWNKLVGAGGALPKDSVLAVIMRTQCPGVVEAYGLAALQIE